MTRIDLLIGEPLVRHLGWVPMHFPRQGAAVALGMLLTMGVSFVWSAGPSPASAGPADVPATQPAAKPAEALEARIAKLIAQLASERHTEREAAHKALMQIGKPAIRALQVAGKDEDPERASRAQSALKQIKERTRLTKETWRNRWERMSLSFGLSTPTGKEGTMSLDIDPRGKAVARLWEPRRKASVRYESVLARKDLDATAKRLGRQRLWDLHGVPKWPAPDGRTITFTITVDGRSIHIEQTWPPPKNMPQTRLNALLLSALMGTRDAMMHLIAVVRRDAAIRAQQGAAKRPDQAKETPATEPGGERTALRKVLDLLDLPWQTKLTLKQLDESAASIRPRADQAVEAILKGYNQTNSNSFRHRAVQILQRLGTTKARAALLDIALGRTADKLPSAHGWAARAYLKTIPDKADARKLLASDNPQVLNSALLALKGQPTDEALLKRIRQIIQRKEDHPSGWQALRLAAADVLWSDPRAVLLPQRVDLLLAMLADVAKMPGKDKTLRHSTFTYAEMAYARLLLSLVNMPTEAGPLLKKASAQRRGVERDILVICRASRGDATVRKDIRAILADAKAGFRRVWAARALGVVGGPEDLPLLKRLAETDPLARKTHGDVGPPGGRNAKFYPVRQEAKEAIRVIERKGAAPP